MNHDRSHYMEKPLEATWVGPQVEWGGKKKNSTT